MTRFVIFYVTHDFAGTRDIIASDDEIHLNDSARLVQTEASFAITQILAGNITSLLLCFQLCLQVTLLLLSETCTRKEITSCSSSMCTI